MTQKTPTKALVSEIQALADYTVLKPFKDGKPNVISSSQISRKQAESVRLQEFAQYQLLRFRKNLLDPAMAAFFMKRKAQMKGFSKEAIEMIDQIQAYILRSGKRFRSGLIYYMYLGLNKGHKDAAVKAAMAMEFLHGFLLIHDDIIDQDRLRRGKPSMHNTYELIFHKKLNGGGVYSNADGKHFGESMGIVAGDVLMSLCYEILAELDLKKDQHRQIIKIVNQTLTNVCIGQMIEVYHGLRGNVSKKEIYEVYNLKTAQYTMRCPIIMAAILAGAPRSVIRRFEGFSYDLGIAFQIQDDIIGMFGTERKIGKPVGSDIKEGKETLLIHVARKKATTKQREVLDYALGNSRLTFQDVKAVRRVVVETGSLDYCRRTSIRLKNKAWKSIDGIRMKQEAKDFLEGISEYIVARNK